MGPRLDELFSSWRRRKRQLLVRSPTVTYWHFLKGFHWFVNNISKNRHGATYSPYMYTKRGKTSFLNVSEKACRFAAVCFRKNAKYEKVPVRWVPAHFSDRRMAGGRSLRNTHEDTGTLIMISSLSQKCALLSTLHSVPPYGAAYTPRT